MTKRRRRFKQTTSLHERLTAFSKEARKKANQLPPGHERREQMAKAHQAENAVHLEDWINSAGLQPPT